VLLADGGLVSPPGLIAWDVTLPANLAAGIGHHPAAASLLPDATAITGCILSSLLAAGSGAATTIGPVSAEACRAQWQGLQSLGIGAAPLRCGAWSPSEAYLARFRSRFGRTDG